VTANKDGLDSRNFYARLWGPNRVRLGTNLVTIHTELRRIQIKFLYTVSRNSKVGREEKEMIVLYLNQLYIIYIYGTPYCIQGICSVNHNI
jgi:hypothetical protein